MLLEPPTSPAHARRRWRGSLAVAFALSLTVIACADDDASSSRRDEDGAGPTTSDAPDARSGAPDDSIERVALRQYVTRPDVTPPAIHTVSSTSPTPGFVFLAPKRAGAQAGPLIVDDRGETVWSAPVGGSDVAADLRVQTYDGEPVLTWWEGRSAEGRGEGELVIVDRRYREVARLQTGNGRQADFHEFRLTDEGTALLIAYSPESADLSAVGGPQRGYEFENYVQEVDVATGEVLMEWRAGDHVPVSDTFSELSDRGDGSEDLPLDWFHANSVAPGPDGTLLVSARNTHAIYAIDRATGELRWTLGGKGSDITMGPGTPFLWQHDAEWLGGNRISLFDNHASTMGGEASRALILDVDTEAMTAAVLTEVRHDGVSAGTQGNTQMLTGGGLLVGWGSEGRVTEFSAAGDVVFDATFTPADSYRAYRFEWEGQPAEPPDVVVTALDDGGSGGGSGEEAGSGDGDRPLEVAMSWNGATAVTTWRVLAGEDADDLAPVAEVRKDGFETTTRIERAAVVAVEALDSSGEVLDRSDTIAIER
ncbi:MAG: arylsulfotransferase family protein [Acidimicrobiales bacterium]